MFILPVHNLINTGQSLFVMSLLHSLSSNDCLRKKYARVETQLKNICFFVSLATIPFFFFFNFFFDGFIFNAFTNIV